MSIRLSWKLKNLVFFLALSFSLLIYFFDKNFLGNEIALILPYLFIISLVTILIGNKSGIFFVILSWLLWTFSAGYAHRELSYANYIDFFIKGLFLLLHFYTIRYIKILYEKTQELSLKDELTGLLNRRGFNMLGEHEMTSSIRESNFVTLVFIDIDNFKTINDKLGHAEGDKVLKTLAIILQKSMRNSDIIARFGGDEFCLLLSFKENTDARTVVERIVKNFKEQSIKNSWVTTLSIGVLTVEKSQSLYSLIQEADKLMYEAKKKGKNQINFLALKE